MFFLPARLIAGLLTGAVVVSAYYMLSYALVDDQGEAVFEERVMATVISSHTAVHSGRYSGKSMTHTGRIELPDGSNAVLYFPTAPVVGSSVEVKLVEYENGDTVAFQLNALDY